MQFRPMFVASALFVLHLSLMSPVASAASRQPNTSNLPMGMTVVNPVTPNVQMGECHQLYARKGIPRRREGGGTRYTG